VGRRARPPWDEGGRGRDKIIGDDYFFMYIYTSTSCDGKKEIPNMDSKDDRSQRAQDLEKRLESWICSGGEEALREATRQAQECTDKLQEMRRVDPKKLNEPFTV
jgi:hypothetical protein